MSKRTRQYLSTTALVAVALVGGAASSLAYLSPNNPLVNTWPAAQTVNMGPSYTYIHPVTDPLTPYIIGPGDVPDYLTTPNWAYSPLLTKFVDTMPGICGTAGGTNAMGQCIPVAVPDIVTYPGSDYYVIELRQYREQMHSELPVVTDPLDFTSGGGTLLREYMQTSLGTDTSACTDPSLGQANPCAAGDNTVAAQARPQYLGPLIVARKDRPVRIKFVNNLPTTALGGNLFVPVDQTIMGAGSFTRNYDPVTNASVADVSGTFTQNRANLHLHGGRSPWISDGTPHQWITPAGDAAAVNYPKGVSVTYVPDMWFDANGDTIAACAGQTTCNQAGATNNPGPGAQTYYYTNQQSSRMLFYHDHSWGITRLNVYVGGAAGYLIRDTTEQGLIDAGTIPGTKSTGAGGGLSYGGEIPLVIQDKTFVDETTIKDTDPTWAWGSQPWNGIADSTTTGSNVMTPVRGDLWWPHIYMPAQNPYDITGIAPMGRWAYGPYFWPATANFFQPVPNPYYSDACDPADANTPGSKGGFCQPYEIPSTPNPSWGAEAFMDTPLVNGTAYPVLNVDPKPYRFRVLNAAHDRFFNLQLYQAVDKTAWVADAVAGDGVGLCTGGPAQANCTEIKMVPAVPGGAGKPASWPEDGRPGGVPDWNTKGPDWIMIGNEGGFLPKPVVLPAHPVNWNADVTTFNAGNVNAGSLLLAPAERADVIVDFSAYAGQTLILYNDAPAPWPALDPHYDYFTGAPDNRDMGGADTTLPGKGPNTRTIMQIQVGSNGAVAFDAAAMTALNNAFTPATPNEATGVFRASQDPIIVAQGNMNPTGDPAHYEAFPFEGVQYAYDVYNTIYGATLPSVFPNWGISRINDRSISFKTINSDGTVNPTVKTVAMKAKAIQDEQGETFDEFGRMRAGLGLTASTPGAGQVNFQVQTYSDPSTEVVYPNDIQLWKITHNGVDTHPIHFHLFDVQVVNRVGWDGFIRLPDPTEMGWKETVRISPLEDTIVALKPVTPRVPFSLPPSVRPLNPATKLGDATELTQVDPVTGQPRLNNNRIINAGYEYVWHCHILSHEENDMMRPISFNTVAKLDLLWRNASNGANSLWFMNGLSLAGTASVTKLTDLNWRIVGRADFNGDSKADILWRNTSNGSNSVWYMDGANRLGTAPIMTLADQNWNIVGTGDFNNDGKQDILWRHIANGSLSAWYMDGVTRIGTVALPKLADLNWHVVTTSDFNNDGKVDILWRNKSNGTNVIWYMNGVVRISTSTIPQDADQNWVIVGSGDFNNDNYADIIWRNVSTGLNRVWYMQGRTRLGTVNLPALADVNWKLVEGPAAYDPAP